MSAMAREYGALNLSQGFPEFNPPEELIDEINLCMQQGFNQYAPMPGYMELREAIRKKEFEIHNNVVDAEAEITVTPGATVALFATIQALVEKGDEVILMDPAYDSYQAAVEWAGGRCVRVRMNLEDLSFPLQELSDKVSAKTKLIILTTPHNPLGSIMGASDWDELARITEPFGTFILSDEVYEHMVFDESRHISVLQNELLRNRSIKISSFGKTFHSTGWKLGYLIAQPSITAAVRKLYQYINFSTHSASQQGLMRYMNAHPKWEIELSTFYQSKRDVFRQALRGSPWEILNCQGSYFQILGFNALSQETDDVFAERLTKEYKIASIPINVFNEKPTRTGLLRFCFAKSDETLLKAADILKSIKLS